MTLEYHDVRSRAGAFHKNFSRGDFDANGLLVAKDIKVNSNNVEFQGADAFVDRIKRFSIPFPGLQLRDSILVVDGHDVAVLYYMQGEHLGPFGPMEASGNRIEVLAGELFKFDQQGLMSELVTVTRLDHVALQIKGHRHVHSHQTVSLAEPVQLNPSIAANLRATAKGLHDKLISGDFSDVAENVLVNVDGAHESGVATLRMHFNDLLTAFGDLGVEHETVLVDGDRVAIGYQLNGVHTDTWQQPSGDILAPANKRVQVRVIDFLRFDASGKLSEYVSVVNTDDIAKQIKGD